MTKKWPKKKTFRIYSLHKMWTHFHQIWTSTQWNLQMMTVTLIFFIFFNQKLLNCLKIFCLVNIFSLFVADFWKELPIFVSAKIFFASQAIFFCCSYIFVFSVFFWVNPFVYERFCNGESWALACEPLCEVVVVCLWCSAEGFYPAPNYVKKVMLWYTLKRRILRRL